MIKVGILGADTQLGGELIRVLLHHPEVEIVALHAPALRGRKVSSFHKGMVGEIEMKFSDSIDFQNLDILFLLSGSIPVDFMSEIPSTLRIIDLSEESPLPGISSFDDIEFVPGLSEMYRKSLVRGARASRILPSPVATALIALYPLALHLLLNDKLNIKISLPSFKKDAYSAEHVANIIELHLRQIQLSFNKIKNIEIETSPTIRTLSVQIEFPCNVTEKEIERIYNDIYDDHNFSFLVHTDPNPSEVAGTQKCLLYVSKSSEDILRIKIVSDCLLRGGAGDAVHVMNLLFGLFEKTGLNLQASLAFGSPKIKTYLDVSK